MVVYEKYICVLIVFNQHNKLNHIYSDGDFTCYFNTKSVSEKLTPSDPTEPYQTRRTNFHTLPNIWLKICIIICISRPALLKFP
jgi:hypothetical protein